MGCNPNPFCLNCDNSDGATAPFDFSSASPIDAVPQPDVANGPCVLSNGGVEICDGIDNDCNGVKDDVPASKLGTDGNNCGSCGHVCSYAAALGVCSGGVCTMGACVPGHYDINRKESDGCEYECALSPLPKSCQKDGECPPGVPCTGSLCGKPCSDASGPGEKGGCAVGTACRELGVKVCVAEQCDGADNNCNKAIDEGFDTTGDINNCGGCGVVCNFLNAVATCKNSTCVFDHCFDGYKDIEGQKKACAYQCPVWPTVAEKCNNLDDDCNGLKDDNPTDVGQFCDSSCASYLDQCVANKNCAKPSVCSGKCCGLCSGGGKTVCWNNQIACQAGTAPQLELCDGKDNNCDGRIDEGFDFDNDLLHCGGCGQACSPAHAIGQCASGNCTIKSCLPGWIDVDKQMGNGCEVKCDVDIPTVEVCNGLDDDCDGVPDNKLTLPQQNPCKQTGPCNGAQLLCCGASGWLCNYPSVSNHIEVTNLKSCGGQQGANLALAEAVCDGWDGNCDGTTDESFANKGKACTVGNGICAGSSLFVCSQDGKSTVCPASATPTNAVDELCNGIDDDCDGQVDERTPANGAQCYNGGPHNCLGWKDAMVLASGVWIYQYEASRPDAVQNGMGAMSSRACARSGVLPWTQVTWAQARAACMAVKDSQGSSMRLCEAAEWSDICAVSSVQDPIWSYANNPATYNTMTCNGYDRGLGATWATGSGAQCYAKQANGNVYDMSGNVAEWTSTPVNGTYYKVRGGAFDNFALGTNCQFDFPIEQATYLSIDLGFRCCADHAP